MGDNAANARILNGGAGAPAGEHVVRAPTVIGFAVGHGANNTYLVRNLRRVLQVLGKKNPVELGFYRAQGSAVFNGNQQFGIERFLGRDPARQENIDDRFSFGGGGRGLGLQFEKVSERQAQTADQTNKKELAAVRPPNMLI